MRGPLTQEISENDATTPLRSDVEDSAALPQTTPPERAATTSNRTFPSSILPSWMSKPSEPRRRPSLDEKSHLMESPEALEVVVVIAMPTRPSPISSSSLTHAESLSSVQPLLQSQVHSIPHSPIISQVDRDDEKSPIPPPPSHLSSHLPEYQIGLTLVPWHTELNSTSVPMPSS